MQLPFDYNEKENRLDLTLSAGLLVVGLGLIFAFSEGLLKGAVGTSLGAGVTTFIISVVFIGFDPDKLIIGTVGSLKDSPGIALGSILGATMVVISLGFGITALVCPMRFRNAPKRALAVPVLAEILFGLLGFDGWISRTDGSVLLLGFVLSIMYLLRLSKRGLDIKAAGDVKEVLEKGVKMPRWESFSLLITSLAGMVIGSILLIEGSKTLMEVFGISDTIFGMTVLSLLISLGDLARDLPAAWKGRPDISYGNVSGSIVALFLFNGGVMASIKPIPVDPRVLSFYLPLCITATCIITLFMMGRKVPRLGGVFLIVLYLVFFGRGYLDL
jgi:cation:H+ antiporter